MKTFHYLPLLVVALLVASCREKNPETIPSVPIDAYEGEHTEIRIGQQTRRFVNDSTVNIVTPEKIEFVCRIATPEGNIIERKGVHLRPHESDSATLKFEVGLKEGVYRLLSLSAIVGDSIKVQSRKQFGLGFRVKFQSSGKASVLDTYNFDFDLSGSGTASDPMMVVTSDDLYKIRRIVNNGDDNYLVTQDTYFEQAADIDLDYESFLCDAEYGWLPIGNDPITPFRGNYNGKGYTLSNLWCYRQNSLGIGLFGYIQGATISNVVLKDATILGHSYVGGIAGATIVPGDLDSLLSCCFLESCKVQDCFIGHTKQKGSMFVGGILGGSDLYARLFVDSCSVEGNSHIEGDYWVGGILGGGTRYSKPQINRCKNYASITGNFASVGGIAGSADSIIVNSCYNHGRVEGARLYVEGTENTSGYGVGGIVGGFRNAILQGVVNTGSISGYDGVGGIIGGSRWEASDFKEGGLLGDCYVTIAHNQGSVTGKTAVGGICGEAQFGGNNCLNSGSVTAQAEGANVGGICGTASIAAIEACINTGKVNGEKECHTAGGLVGLCNWASVLCSENFGPINVKADYSGGLLGLSSTNTVLSYCTNYGQISNAKSGAKVGGLIGEVGNPREWPAKDIFSIVLGSVEVVASVAGAVIAGVTTAVEGAETVLAHVAHIMHKVHTGLDVLLMISDAGYMIYHGNHKHQLHIELSQRQCENDIRLLKEELLNQISDYRANFVGNARNFSLQSGLNHGSLVNYANNYAEVLKDFNSSQERQVNFTDRMNEIRLERAEEIEAQDEAIEKVHEIIGGICLGVAAVTLVVGSVVAEVASGGALTPVVVAAFGVTGAIFSVGGGVNLITEGVMDFENNVVVVSQCGNLGQLDAANASNVGGLVGYFHQTCEIRHSFNLGQAGSSKGHTAGILGYMSADNVMNSCINYGTGWGSHLFYKPSTTSAEYNDNYYYLVDANGKPTDGSVSVEALTTPNGLAGITGKFWTSNADKRYFALPYQSELQTEATITYEEHSH